MAISLHFPNNYIVFNFFFILTYKSTTPLNKWSKFNCVSAINISFIPAIIMKHKIPFVDDWLIPFTKEIEYKGKRICHHRVKNKNVK